MMLMYSRPRAHIHTYISPIMYRYAPLRVPGGHKRVRGGGGQPRQKRRRDTAAEDEKLMKQYNKARERKLAR